MNDTVTLRLTDPQLMEQCGGSLARTLYRFPVDILLIGELGAGKTTFLRGLLRALGVLQHVTSPTFALEQRYVTNGQRTADNGQLLHIDLYRLSQGEAEQLLQASNDHQGIRCIEWADRIKEGGSCHIEIRIEEAAEGRKLTARFSDIPLPSREDCERWREEVMLQPHIARHCDAVRDVAVRLADILLRKGILIRKLALTRAAELHDLFRFVDFKNPVDAKNYPPTKKQEEVWSALRKKFAGLRHEDACTQFLSEQGFPEIGEIVRTHGLTLSPDNTSTIEQKLLFYADKCVKVDQIVTVEERFRDFRERYGESSQTETWYAQAKKVEEELFPEGVAL